MGSAPEAGGEKGQRKAVALRKNGRTLRSDLSGRSATKLDCMSASTCLDHAARASSGRRGAAVSPPGLGLRSARGF